jgi:hypothetical protein
VTYTSSVVLSDRLSEDFDPGPDHYPSNEATTHLILIEDVSVIIPGGYSFRERLADVRHGVKSALPRSLYESFHADLESR